MPESAEPASLGTSPGAFDDVASGNTSEMS